jgi:hypothetical protein
LINTLKVNYNKWEKEFSFIKILKYFLTGKKDDELYLAANKEIIEELLSKEENQWSHEREWRILLSSAENVFFADLVSAIYIDERCITDKNCKENCEKLIELCKTKKWNDILVLVVTFALTVIFDLVKAIAVGIAIHYIIVLIYYFIAKNKAKKEQQKAE